MNLTQLMSIVVASQKKDWNHIVCWGNGGGPSYRDHLRFYERDYKGTPDVLRVDAHPDVAVYLHDVSITLAFGLSWMNEFKEEWTEKFPDRHASSSYADVFYNGALVYRTQYVTVDGGRTNLPLPPRRDEASVPKAYAQFIAMLDSFGKVSSFYEAFRRAGMVLSDEMWPDFGQERAEKGIGPRGFIQ